ncbi:Uncharacterised protein [Mycobacteroides abscessus subsp. abscessus]|nr:Uncharacterised protein [Mycobacteroides abscessus subsp. abscessus]
MTESVVEIHLVIDGAGDDDIGMLFQQCGYPILIPSAVRQCPAVVVGVDGAQTTAGQLPQQGGLTRTRHACHQHPRHT